MVAHCSLGRYSPHEQGACRFHPRPQAGDGRAVPRGIRGAALRRRPGGEGPHRRPGVPLAGGSGQVADHERVGIDRRLPRLGGDRGAPRLGETASRVHRQSNVPEIHGRRGNPRGPGKPRGVDMETKTLDIQKLLSDYVDDLNVAVESRQFPPFVQKWFAVPQCMLSFKHETQGIENAKTLWTHLLPIGVEGAPREVLQFPYKVENGRVYAWRQLQGGSSPKPLYGLQETQFDDRTLISEISIMSVQDKPEVNEDPAAATSRLGRIFGAFADAFNVFFQTGDTDIIEEWCSPDIVMKLDSTFWGMGVIGPHNRIAQTARFTLSGWEADGDRIKANVDFTGWGGLSAGTPWDLALTPEGKFRELK